MLKIHVLFEHSTDLQPHGCSHIRLLLPLRHPTNQGAFEVSADTAYAGGADVVIVERMWKPDALAPGSARQLVRCIRQDGARLIYVLDDNLLDLHPTSFARAGLTETQQMFVRHLAREADGVIVSTAPLAERMARLNRNIVVVPNMLDERLFSGPERRAAAGNERKVIGYMGTFSHDADLLMILQALRAVLRRHAGRVELQLVGGLADAAVLRAFEGLPVQVLDASQHAQYPDFVRWMRQTLRWDVGIAPLEDNAFTRCKSDIKFLDYSALGLAGVYSRVPAYAETVRHLETGWLAENTPEAWEAGLETLLADDGLRERLARNAAQVVASSRMLQGQAPLWLGAVRSLLPPIAEKTA